MGAHSLDELHDRPLGTSISGRWLVVMAAGSLTGAGGLGLVGMARVGAGLAVFIVAGVVLAVAYNLELLGGRLHNDATFAAWGAFPLVTAYYVQTSRLSLPALVAAGAVTGCHRRNDISAPRRARFAEGWSQPLGRSR